MAHVAEIFRWVPDHWGLIFESLAAWVVFLVLTIVAVRYYLISIEPDYFAPHHHRLSPLQNSHPVLRWTFLIAKNGIGLTLLLVGLIMLVTPGPGWFAILVGLALVDLPGKRNLERWVLRRPAIFHLVGHLRAKAGKPPLRFEPE